MNSIRLAGLDLVISLLDVHHLAGPPGAIAVRGLEEALRAGPVPVPIPVIERDAARVPELDARLASCTPLADAASARMVLCRR